MKLFSVMVTGANRGIGLEFVRQLVRLNPPPKHVFATYRDCKRLQDLRQLRDAFQITTKIYLIQMDVTSISDITNATKIVDDIVGEEGLTLLINNAGVLLREHFHEITRQALNIAFSVNAAGPILLTQTIYPLLKRSAEKRNKSGMSFSRAGIVNISTSGTLERATTGDESFYHLEMVPYQISKAALNTGMRLIASSAKKDNILVIMMEPGWVKTELGGDNAEVELKDSVEAMLNTISTLDENYSGVFMDRHGNSYLS